MVFIFPIKAVQLFMVVDHYILTSVTIPEQIIGVSPIVSATEDALDIKVVCKIFNGDIPFITDRKLIRNSNPTLLRFFFF